MKSFVIMFIDLDKFKVINDTMGHSFGDIVLQTVSEKICACLTKEDLLARYGGDEFIAVLHNTNNTDAEKTAKKMINMFSEPLKVKEQELDITVSIGISQYPDDSQSAENLIKYADIAMYQGKILGRNNYMFYTKEMSDRVQRKLELEKGMKSALKNHEFLLHYQPEIDFCSGAIRKAS